MPAHTQRVLHPECQFEMGKNEIVQTHETLGGQQFRSSSQNRKLTGAMHEILPTFRPASSWASQHEDSMVMSE